MHNNLHRSPLHEYGWRRRSRTNVPIRQTRSNTHQRSRIPLQRSGKVTNPADHSRNLIFEVHQYFDSDNSGTHANCVGDGIDAAFVSMVKYLRENNQIVLLAETGGGFNDESCLTVYLDLYPCFPFSTSRLGFIVDRSIPSPSIKSPI